MPGLIHHPLWMAFAFTLLFAKRYPDVHCLLVGEPQAIEQTLRAQGNVDTSWYDILPASEVVTMADSV